MDDNFTTDVDPLIVWSRLLDSSLVVHHCLDISWQVIVGRHCALGFHTKPVLLKSFGSEIVS